VSGMSQRVTIEVRKSENLELRTLTRPASPARLALCPIDQINESVHRFLPK